PTRRSSARRERWRSAPCSKDCANPSTTCPGAHSSRTSSTRSPSRRSRHRRTRQADAIDPEEGSPVRPTRVLVLNSGSSSVKYQLFDMATTAGKGRRLTGGIVERIGEGEVPDHQTALRMVADELAEAGYGLDSPELAAIGHRVVHGGRAFTQPTLINEEVIEDIDRLVPLAPLH